MRRSFDDPLYKEIFRSYVAYLVREGFTQEFFIEGGRSRTGKTLPPRLGMLTWDVDAFIDSHQHDLVFIPVAITYERLVEESSILDELSGGAKTEESVWNLVRARKYLERRLHLWPEVGDYHALMLMRESEVPASFDSEKQNEPVNPLDCLFLEEDFRFWDDRRRVSGS